MKKKTKNIIIGISILFLILGVYGVSQIFKQAPSQVFMDKELGMITTSEQGILTEQAFFKSTSGSGITVSNVGEKVQICDVFAKVSNYKYTDYIWSTSLNGNTISSQNMVTYANSKTSYCKSWTPIKAGNYEVRSIYTLCPDVGVVRPEDCLHRDSSDVKRYKLEVKAIEDTCNKNPYTGAWYTDKYIDNGKIVKAKVFKVSNDCTYVVNFYLTQTQCNDNYLIENSNYKMTEGEGFKCVSAKTDDPIIDEDNNEIIDDYEERDPECNIDFYETCGDNTKIISKLCVEGLYFDSGNICSEIGEPDETEVIYQNETENKTVKEIECSSNIECQSVCGTKIPTCENNACFCSGQQVFIEVETPIYFYIIPVSIFGLIALIVWMKMKKPKRKKK